MLPVLLDLSTRRTKLRRTWRSINAYTLWAFNAQPPLAPGRDHMKDRAHADEHAS